MPPRPPRSPASFAPASFRSFARLVRPPRSPAPLHVWVVFRADSVFRVLSCALQKPRNVVSASRRTSPLSPVPLAPAPLTHGRFHVSAPSRTTLRAGLPLRQAEACLCASLPRPCSCGRALLLAHTSLPTADISQVFPELRCVAHAASSLLILLSSLCFSLAPCSSLMVS